VSNIVVPASASFPQTGINRTISSILTHLQDYVGGGGVEGRSRALRALDETVRAFNSMAWRFNRKSTDITFVASTSDYALPATVRSVWKVMLLDSDDELIDEIPFVTYQDFLLYDGSTQSPVSIPNEYTLFNMFDTGNIRFLPRLGTTFSYPKARVFYHIRIVVPSADDESTLTVPQEVETAIVRQAAALLVARTRTFEEAARARADADNLTAAAQREWRDFPDMSQKMR